MGVLVQFAEKLSSVIKQNYERRPFSEIGLMQKWPRS